MNTVSFQPEQTKYEHIKNKLLILLESDQKMRSDFRSGKGEWDEKIDENNTNELKKIISTIGWPTISKVGSDASRAAWLILQHSPDRDFQQECLKIMKQLLPGEIDIKNIAFLEDRVRIAKGEKQIYGTQFRKNNDGEFEPLPIEDESNVNKRRAEIGLNTIEEYAKGFRDQSKT